jgi:iron(III) transport system substrate-binding protein
MNPMRTTAAGLALAAALAACSADPPATVTVYTSVDDGIAREMLARFTAETGIPVDAVTDTEATKSVGLALRLEEEGRPGGRARADVFWNNEPLWTVRLAEKGLFEKYESPAAKDIPAAHRDPKGFWAANGLRARIFIAHAASAKEGRPVSWRDLAAPAFRDRGSLARPLAGTTLSHMAALRARIGAGPYDDWFRAAAANGTAFASGNGAVAREVGRGTRAFGFTDTDDFHVRRKAGDPVEAIFPDQEEGGTGTWVLPITVSLVRGAPHRKEAERLVDWLLSPAAEEALSASDFATIPVRPASKAGPGAFPAASFRAAATDWNAAAGHVEAVTALAKEILMGSK